MSQSVDAVIKEISVDLKSLPDPESARADQLARVRRPREDDGDGETSALSYNEGLWIIETPLGSAVMLRCGGTKDPWIVTRAMVIPSNLKGYKGCLFTTGGVDPSIELGYRDGAQTGLATKTRRELVQIVREAVRRRIRELQKESEG